MRATRLHLVMTCSRPRNIPLLAPAYLEKMEPHPFELRWHILVQGPEPDPKGVSKTNEALDYIRDGWVMTLADDTDQHPALFRRLGEVIEANPEVGAVVFSQDRGAQWILRPTPETMIPGHVCGGQVVWKRDFLGDTRFDWNAYGVCCDGFMIQKMHQENPAKFVFVDEVLMKFNSLEW